LGQDYRGFSNGVTNRHLLIYDTNLAKTAEPSAMYGADRTPHFNFAVSGALKRLTYPTGGCSDFVYEAHTLIDNGNTLQGGGIRIKQMTHVANNTQQTQTSYGYVKPYFTNNLYQGSLANLVYFYPTSKTINIAYLNPNGSDCVLRTDYVTTYPEGLGYALGSNSGSSIAYEEVEVYQEDGQGNRLGKKHYSFQTGQDIISNTFPSYEISASWQRGQLLNEKTYSYVNNADLLIQEQAISYTTLTQPYKTRGYTVRLETDDEAGLYVIQNPTCGLFSVNNAYTYAEINEETAVYLPTQSLTTVYDQNGQNPVETLTTTVFNSVHLQPTSTTTTNSNGTNFALLRRYPHDYVGNAAYDEMLNRHIYSPVVEVEQQAGGVMQKKLRTNYQQWFSGTTYEGLSGFFCTFLCGDPRKWGTLANAVDVGGIAE